MAEFTEWRNQNRYRKYPFGDRASLESVEGPLLAEDSLLDALVFVDQSAGAVYLSAWEAEEGKLVLSSVDTGDSVASGLVGEGESTQLTDQHGRYAGTLVFDRQRLPAQALTFEPSATTLVISCVSVHNSRGVRGVTLNDLRLRAGSVTLVAQHGLQWDRRDSSSAYLHAIGERSSLDVDRFGAPIKGICVKTSASSPIEASAVGSMINLSASAELGALCPATESLPDAAGNLPLGDPCVAEPDPEDPGYSPDTECTMAYPVLGKLYVNPVGTAIRVHPVTVVPPVPMILEGAGDDPDAAIQAIQSLPPRAAEGLNIGFAAGGAR